MNLPIIKYRYWWLTISAVIFGLAILMLLIFGLKPAIDFTGGSLMEITFNQQRPEISEFRQQLKELNFSSEIIVQPTEDKGMILRFKETGEESHLAIWNKMNELYPDNFIEERFESVGSVVGSEMKTKAIYSIIVVSIAIIIYIAIAFRKVSFPVASWKYGTFAIISLIHDITVTAGVFALLGKFAGIEVGLPFVAALLTVLGYSVNDTIVIFDRVRENLGRVTKTDFAGIVNRSVNETMSRSINTTLTTLVTLGAIYLFGGDSIKYFALALIIGIFLGAYSSIFVASSLLVVSEEKSRNRK